MAGVQVLGITAGAVAAKSRSLMAARILHSNAARARSLSSAASALAARPGTPQPCGATPMNRDKVSLWATAAAAAAAASASALAAWKTDAGVSECAPLDVDGDDAFEPGQAVGVGIKAEMWKTKHPNLTILEVGEDTPVLGLMSIVRNVATEPAAFVSAADRLMRQLLDYAVMGFPSEEEAVFFTPAQVRMQGSLPEEDVGVCAISVCLEHEPAGVFDAELQAAFPSFERGSLRVKGLTRGSGKELPANMQGKRVLLLAPVVGYAQPVMAALERLGQAGVEDEFVTLVSVVISKEAVEALTEDAGEMSVVCGAMDGETRGVDHMVVPGVGEFSQRYLDAKAAVEEEARSKAEELKSSSRRRRPWWPWGRGG